MRIPTGTIELEGNLGLVDGAEGVVLFAHGSGSGRSSPRNLYVARVLSQADLSTLLIDLLTAKEEAVDLRTRQLRFDIGVLAERLVGATNWLRDDPRHPEHEDRLFRGEHRRGSRPRRRSRAPG